MVACDFRYASDIRSDHRHPRRHGFKDDVRHLLRQRRIHQNVGAGKEPPEILDVAGKNNFPRGRGAGRPRHTFQLRPKRPVAKDDEARLRAPRSDLGSRPNEVRSPFLRAEPSRRHDQHGVLPKAVTSA